MELRNPAHMRLRLYELWGDLLQARSHKQLQELLSQGGGRGAAEMAGRPKVIGLANFPIWLPLLRSGWTTNDGKEGTQC